MACGDNEFWEKIFNKELEKNLSTAMNSALQGSFGDGYAAQVEEYKLSNLTPVDAEPTSREYVDQQLSTGDLHFDGSEMLVFDGSNEWTAVTNTPVTAITVPALEVNGVDILAKLEELDNMVQELTGMKHREQIGEKICALADEIDSQKNNNAFENAMKGI